jgi:thioredoxin reductase (NADPH)
VEIGNEYDVIIVGAGPAGLTAGIYTSRSGLQTLILEEKFIGGMMAEAPLIENYPGLQEGVGGLDLANRMESQARKFGVQIINPEKVTGLLLQGERKVVKVEKDTYSAIAVILAVGCDYRRLGVPGEQRFHGKGVSYCATCDGPFFKGKTVLVVGGGNSAATSAIYLSALASKVILVHRRGLLRADEVLIQELRDRNITVILNTVVREIKGEAKVENVILENTVTTEKDTRDVDGVFVQIGETPNSQIANDAGVRIGKDGYIFVDHRQRTNIEGVFAAGDVTNCSIKQIGTAVGQAIIAALEAFSYVKKRS